MLQQLGRYDGTNYYLIKGGKEIKVSQMEYELKTSDSPLAKYIWKIIKRLDTLAQKL